MSSPKRRNILTVSQKLQILQCYDDQQLCNVSIRKAASELKMPTKTFHNLLASRKNLSSINGSRKNNNPSMFPELDKALLVWYHGENNNDNINGVHLKIKANELAHSLNINTKIDKSWIQRWKSRNGIHLKTNTQCQAKFSDGCQNDKSPVSDFNKDGLLDADCLDKTFLETSDQKKENITNESKHNYNSENDEEDVTQSQIFGALSLLRKGLEEMDQQPTQFFALYDYEHKFCQYFKKRPSTTSKENTGANWLATVD